MNKLKTNEETCKTCRLATLDSKEYFICYATGKRISREQPCDCNAYDDIRKESYTFLKSSLD